MVLKPFYTRTCILNGKKRLLILSDQGFAGSCLSAVVHTWGLRLKGPVYISIFKPLSIVIAAAMGVIFLGDALYLERYIILSLSLFANAHAQTL